jgi:hypothetical protein
VTAGVGAVFGRCSWLWSCSCFCWAGVTFGWAARSVLWRVLASHEALIGTSRMPQTYPNFTHKTPMHPSTACLPPNRWGHTPLDEARRVGARVVVDYLEALVAQRQEASAWRTARKQRITAAAAAAAAAATGEAGGSGQGAGGAAALAGMDDMDVGSGADTGGSSSSSSSSNVGAYSRGPTVAAEMPSDSSGAVALGAPITRTQDMDSMRALPPSAASQAPPAATAPTGSTMAGDQSGVSVDQPGGTSGNNVLPVQPPSGVVAAGSNEPAAGVPSLKAESWCPPAPAPASAAAAVPPKAEVVPAPKRR